MRRFRRHQRGLAEIVGTLMLVVIVVAAVTAFSLFVAGYQQQVQKQESYVHNQALESLHVTAIRPSYNSTGNVYNSLNLTVISNDINPTVITALTINDDSVATPWLTTVSVPLLGGITIPPGGLNLSGTDFSMPAESSATILVNFGGIHSSFAFPVTLTGSQYVKVNLFTGDSNTFTQVFLPPTPVIGVDVQTIGQCTIECSIETILDGSNSYQQGGNATILSWNWTVQNVSMGNASENETPANSPCLWTPVAYCQGIEVQTEWPMLVGNTYLISLVVTNTDGLVSGTTLTYAPR